MNYNRITICNDEKQMEPIYEKWNKINIYTWIKTESRLFCEEIILLYMSHGWKHFEWLKTYRKWRGKQTTINGKVKKYNIKDDRE